MTPRQRKCGQYTQGVAFGGECDYPTTDPVGLRRELRPLKTVMSIKVCYIYFLLHPLANHWSD